MQPFTIAADIANLSDNSTLSVDVPINLESKESLLSWLAAALNVPGDFGANWDAFEEYLRDLSWVSEHRVVLYHRDLPLQTRRMEQRIYVDVLAAAVRDWQPGEEHELVVAFHPACERTLRVLRRA
jgi:hypothetical protein